MSDTESSPNVSEIEEDETSDEEVSELNGILTQPDINPANAETVVIESDDDESVAAVDKDDDVYAGDVGDDDDLADDPTDIPESKQIAWSDKVVVDARNTNAPDVMSSFVEAEIIAIGVDMLNSGAILIPPDLTDQYTHGEITQTEIIRILIDRNEIPIINEMESSTERVIFQSDFWMPRR